MTTTIIPGYEIPTSSTENYVVLNPFIGKVPTTVENITLEATITAATALPAFTPIGKDSGGDWVIADSGTAADATFLTVEEVPIGGTKVGVYKDGGFNAAAINWDSAYSTDALKKEAFLAKNPQITIHV